MGSAHLEYPLDKTMRMRLLEQFPPRYADIKADHVTISLHQPDTMPQAQDISIVGRADSGDGLEAMVVSVDGDALRADGRPYHITWSLNPEKYRARDSGSLIERFAAAGRIEYFQTPIALGPSRAIWIEETQEGQKSAPSGP